MTKQITLKSYNNFYTVSLTILCETSRAQECPPKMVPDRVYDTMKSLINIWTAVFINVTVHLHNIRQIKTRDGIIRMNDERKGATFRSRMEGAGNCSLLNKL